MPQAIMEAGKLSKFIGTIGRQKVRIDGMIQTAAVQCIAQSIVHRNSTPAAQLFDACGTSTRRDALVAYFEMFGNLAWSKGEKKIIFCDVEAIGKAKLDWSDEYSTKVSEYIWHKAKPEPKMVSEYDVESKLSDFIANLRRQGKKGITLVNVELLDSVEVLYAKHVSDSFCKKATAMDDAQQRKAIEAVAPNLAKADVDALPTIEPMVKAA